MARGTLSHSRPPAQSETRAFHCVCIFRHCLPFFGAKIRFYVLLSKFPNHQTAHCQHRRPTTMSVFPLRGGSAQRKNRHGHHFEIKAFYSTLLSFKCLDKENDSFIAAVFYQNQIYRQRYAFWTHSLYSAHHFQNCSMWNECIKRRLCKPRLYRRTNAHYIMKGMTVKTRLAASIRLSMRQSVHTTNVLISGLTVRTAHPLRKARRPMGLHQPCGVPSRRRSPAPCFPALGGSPRPSRPRKGSPR